MMVLYVATRTRKTLIWSAFGLGSALGFELTYTDMAALIYTGLHLGSWLFGFLQLQQHHFHMFLQGVPNHSDRPHRR